MLFKLRFSFYDYICEYIKATNCKFIISFIDNNISFFKLKKKFTNIKFIIIQNGMRPEQFFNKLSNSQSLQVDYMLTLSDFYSKKYSKNIQGNFITIGSFKNNQILKNAQNLKKNKTISFISSGPGQECDMKIFEKNDVKNELYFYPEKILLPFIHNFCVENKFNLQVLARSKKVKNFLYEKNFYNKILQNKNYDFVSTNERNKVYKISDNSLITISIYSAFGLESLARGNKTVIFNVRDKVSNFESLKLFWSHKNYGEKGFFWTNEMSNNEVLRVLNNVIKCPEQEWAKHLNKVIPSLIDFDMNNSKFKKLLKNEL